MRLSLVLLRCEDKMIGDHGELIQHQKMARLRGRYILYEELRWRILKRIDFLPGGCVFLRLWLLRERGAEAQLELTFIRSSTGKMYVCTR